MPGPVNPVNLRLNWKDSLSVKIDWSGDTQPLVNLLKKAVRIAQGGALLFLAPTSYKLGMIWGGAQAAHAWIQNKNIDDDFHIGASVGRFVRDTTPLSKAPVVLGLAGLTGYAVKKIAPFIYNIGIVGVGLRQGRADGVACMNASREVLTDAWANRPASWRSGPQYHFRQQPLFQLPKQVNVQPKQQPIVQPKNAHLNAQKSTAPKWLNDVNTLRTIDDQGVPFAQQDGSNENYLFNGEAWAKSQWGGCAYAQDPGPDVADLGPDDIYRWTGIDGFKREQMLEGKVQIHLNDIRYEEIEFKQNDLTLVSKFIGGFMGAPLIAETEGNQILIFSAGKWHRQMA